jgi:cytochrome c oxidase subunit 2
LPEARQGARLFQEKTCVSCHAIAGTPATARIGPDLTHVASRQMLAAERVDNTPATLAQWLAGPQALKPGSLMPNLQLTPDEVQLLVAYLETLR